MSLDTRMVHPLISNNPVNKCRAWCYLPNWLYTQLPSWLPHVPRNCNLFGIGVSSLRHAACSAHARDVKPLWISWREKRERGAGENLWLRFGNQTWRAGKSPTKMEVYSSSLGKENGWFSIARFDSWRIHFDEIVFPLLGCWCYCTAWC